MQRLFTAVAISLACVIVTPSLARQISDANGNVVSKKTGASARVSPQYAAQFQAYIDDIEAHGGVVKFMGGIRRGKCWSGGMHPCGKALDVCQTGRGRVDPRCRLPSRHELARIASAHGLFEGGRWCHSDYGHAQVGVSAAACGDNSTMTARRRGGTVTASARSYRTARAQVPTFTPADRLTANY